MVSKKQNTFKLTNLKAEKNFQVPEGYFENFQDRLEKRMSPGMDNTYQPTLIRGLFRSQMAIAASFIGLLIISYVGARIVLNQRDIKSGIYQSGIAENPAYQANEFDENMIYDLYNEEISKDQYVNQDGIENTDFLIEYLVMQDDNIEELIFEL